MKLFPLRRNSDQGGFAGRLSRVGQQVVQHLDNSPLVRQDRGQVQRDIDLQIVASASAQKPPFSLVHHRQYGNRLGSHAQCARLYQGRIEKVYDHVPHALRLVADDATELADLGGIQLGTRFQQSINGPFD